jgi:exopolysaccharide production protein ExoQ
MVKTYLDWAERLFVVVSVIFFCGGLGVGGDSAANLPGIIPAGIDTPMRYGIWALSSLLLCLRWRRTLIYACRDPFLWMLVAMLLLSSAWSENPEVTKLFEREIWQMTAFGLYIATRFDQKEQVKLLGFTLGLSALLSALVAIGLPSAGVHRLDHPGAWKGIYDYKNTLGSIMIMGSLLFFLLPTERPRDQLYKWGGFALSMLVMLASTSKTSLVLAFVLIAIITFYRNFRWKGKSTVIFVDILVLVLASVGYGVVSNWVVLVSGLGKDPSISGRTYIWNGALSWLMERPWWGFGRAAFWAPGSKYAVYVGQVVAIDFVPPHGHNGFLDVALDVGLVGLGLFFLTFLWTCWRALRYSYGSNRSYDYWSIAFLAFLAMNNMTESYLLRLANIYWTLYVAVSLSLPVASKPPLEERQLDSAAVLTNSS